MLMENREDILEQFRRVAEDPVGYGQSMKRKGREIVGFLCTYAPEEIIAAAGFHPFRLFGAHGDISRTDQHLQSYSCSLVRGVLEDALAGRCDFLDGIVFPHTCDSIQRLSDIWRLNIPTAFFADVILPVKLVSESAERYLYDVLAKFRGELAAWSGSDITDEMVTASCEKYNAIRRRMRSIYALHAENPACLSAADLSHVMTASMIMDRDDVLVGLNGLVDKLEEVVPPGMSNRRRIFLVGSVCDQPEIYHLIADAGADVVGDDLCSGTRYCDGEIITNGDPLSAIALRLISRVNCPAKHYSMTARGDRIVKEVKRSRADGVVFLLLKFCDPHAFDYPYIKEMLDAAHIPSMVLEIETQLPSEGTLRTRFETFVHMLR